MNKGELIDAIAQSTNASKAAVAKVLDCFMDTVKDCLKKDGKVALVGFGTFSTITRKARTGRNPQTGKPIKIAAKKVAKFKAAKNILASAAKKKAAPAKKVSKKKK